MSRSCTVCAHPAKGEISVKQVRGIGADTLASQYQPISASALRRHKRDCIPNLLEQGLAALEEHERHETEIALDTIRQLKQINDEAWAALKDAKEDGDRRDILAASDRILNQIRYQSEKLGEISAATTQLIINSPTFVEFKQLVVNTLQDYPEARRELVAHLGALEQGTVDVSPVP
jgi:hypothetical protein